MARHRLALTQSWRFGQAIADEANVWLGVVGSGVRVVGNPSRSSVLSKLAHPDAVLCRSNAATIDEVLAAHATGTKVHLEGDGTEMLALARAAQRMQDGQPAEHPELAAFPDWAAVQAYAENDPNGTDLAVAVRMIDGYGAGTVIEAIEALDILEVGGQFKVAIKALRSAHAALVETDDPELRQQRGRRRVHVVRDAGPAVQQEERLAGVTALADRDYGTRRTNVETVHGSDHLPVHYCDVALPR
jgi:hypothetical protein